jgi:hypothetical protein
MNPARRSVLLAGALAAPLISAGMSSEPVHIEFWTMSLKPKFTPYFEALVRRYESQNPDGPTYYQFCQFGPVLLKIGIASHICHSGNAVASL